MNIMYSCNNDYVMQTIVSMVSLFENNQNTSIVIYLIEDQIDYKNIQFITKTVEQYGNKIVVLPIEKLIPKNLIGTNHRHPHTIYAKLFLQNIEGVSRLLYLDSDTIIYSSLKELYNIELEEEEIVAGVSMPYSFHLKEKIGIKEYPYICDGIVMIDVEKWKKNRYQEKCIEYIKQHEGSPPMLSEGTLNYVCQGHVKIVAPKFNLMPHMLFFKAHEIEKVFSTDNYYTTEEIEYAKKNPVIIHFLKELYERPWNKGCGHPKKSEFKKYYEMVFKENFKKGKTSLPVTVMITKTAYRLLPFNLFLWLYHRVNHDFL